MRLAPNAPGQRHPLHGQAWRAPWRVERAEASRVAQVFQHAAGEWPWTYAARQSLALDEEGLEVRLSLENRSDQPMPAGLGWHPYFRRSPGMRLRAGVGQVWLADADCLPRRLAPGTTFGNRSRGEILPADRCFNRAG